jgi:hypothetical protein
MKPPTFTSFTEVHQGIRKYLWGLTARRRLRASPRNNYRLEKISIENNFTHVGDDTTPCAMLLKSDANATN